MEANLQLRIDRWVNDIAAEEFNSIIGELAEFVCGIVPEKTLNKILFRLLQSLSHAAYKHNGTKSKFGSELTRITSLICMNMTSVANQKKFFSSIYHIVACLLKLSLYYESTEICDYLLPKSNLCHPDLTITILDIYEPTSSLWYKAATNILKSEETLKPKSCNLLIMIVEYDLELLKLASNESSLDILTRILSYTKRISVKNDCNLMEKFKGSIVNYVTKMVITLNDQKSDDTWQLMCELIPILIGKDLNPTGIRSIARCYKSYFEAFSCSPMSDKKYLTCFILWERLSSILLRPVENFTTDTLRDMNLWRKEFNNALMMQQWNTSDVVTTYGILSLLVSTIHYWDQTVKRMETMKYVTNDMIEAMISLTNDHSKIYGNFELKSCHCESSNCNIKTDVSNELVLKIKSFALTSRSLSILENERIRTKAIKLVRTSLELLKKLKNGNCQEYNRLWQPWGASVYNMAVICENNFPADSIEFYTLLYTSIVELEGLKSSKRLWSFEDPLGTILHRLTSVCLKNNEFTRAKSVCSLNGLVSHDIVDSKAYRDWANIKKKDQTNGDTTILEYLRSHEAELANVNTKNYNLGKVCLREIKGLQESKLNFTSSIIAVLNEMKNIDVDPVDYARGVQLLGYHALNFETDITLKKYLRKGILSLGRIEGSTVNNRCLYGTLKFYEFVEKIRDTCRENRVDMKCALLGLTAREKTTKLTDNNEYQVVPCYRALNIKLLTDFECSLKHIFSYWRQFVDSNLPKDKNNWEIICTLNALKIAGEYARLYNFEIIENEAWEMIYKLANEIMDSSSVIYATSRSLTSLYFQPDWIVETEKHMEKLRSTDDRETRDLLTRYKLCMANFYYENGETEKANELFVEVTNNKEVVFMRDFANLLLQQDIEMRHRLADNTEDDKLNYTRIIVKCLYTILSMEETAHVTIYGHKEEQLYNYEILLDSTNNLALRMNSLLSYREISAHLVQRLCTAQKLVTSLRVAECLKYLCYIDLTRDKLDDCEVKLQGLEYLLDIETFEMTMKSELTSYPFNNEIRATTSSHHVDAVRDIGQSDASPVLRKKVFQTPKFMLHGDFCLCFRCTNTRYLCLVFAATHIRAQLFALQGNIAVALQHFHGAMEIRKFTLAKMELADLTNKNKIPSFYQRQREIIDYVMFHLDYCRFLGRSMPSVDKQDILHIALNALGLCEKYKLHNHPIFITINELIHQYRFGILFTKKDYSKFMVPDISEMDVSCYDPAKDPVICVTPVREIIEKRPISIRRRKQPPFLKLDRVMIDLTSDDDATPTPISSTKISKTRRLRRKICHDESYDDDREVTIEETRKRSGEKIFSNKPNDNNKSVERLTRQSGKTIVSSSSDVTTTRTRLRKKSSTCREVGKSPLVPIIKIDAVTELFSDMSMTKRDNTKSLPSLSNAENSSDRAASSLTKKVIFSSSAVISDSANDSENRDRQDGRRGSARLRNKRQNVALKSATTSSGDEDMFAIH